MRSLRVFFPVALLALLLAVGSVSLVVTTQQRQKALTEACRKQILADVARLVRLADQGPGLSSSLLLNEVAQASARPQARMVLLVDESGRVIHAARGDLRGKRLSDVAPGLGVNRAAHAMQGRGRPFHRGRCPGRAAGGNVEGQRPAPVAPEFQQERVDVGGLTRIEMARARDEHVEGAHALGEGEGMPRAVVGRIERAGGHDGIGSAGPEQGGDAGHGHEGQGGAEGRGGHRGRVLLRPGPERLDRSGERRTNR